MVRLLTLQMALETAVSSRLRSLINNIPNTEYGKRCLGTNVRILLFNSRVCCLCEQIGMADDGACPFLFMVVTDDGTLSPTNASCLYLPPRCEETSYTCFFLHGGVTRLSQLLKELCCVQTKGAPFVGSIRRPSIQKHLQGPLKGWRQACRGLVLAS